MPRQSLLEAIAMSIAFFVVAAALWLATLFGLSLVLPPPPDGVAAAALAATPAAILQAGIATTLALLGATWLVGRRWLKLDWTLLRWQGVGRPLGGFGWGFLAAVAMAGLVLVAAVPAGGAAWRRDAGHPDEFLVHAAGNVGLFLLPAFAEELMLRGVPLVLLARALGRGPAILATSVIFGLLHAFNPNVTALALANITLAGIWLAVLFYAPGGIWTATGAHMGWNATLATLESPVSGLDLEMPWLDYDPGGPSWLTGGNFGAEGGVLGTAGLVLGIVLAARYMTRPVGAAQETAP